MKNTFGEKVMLYRKRNSLDQTEMAELLGVSRQTISNYENGKSKPNMDTFMTFVSLETDEEEE